MNAQHRSERSITVNGRFLTQPITGVQRYAYELMGALDSLLTSGALEPIPITVLTPPGVHTLPRWSSIQIRQVGRFTGQMWEQLDLPRYARGTLLFTPCGGAPIVQTRHVITIHDAGPFSTPAAYTAGYRNYYKNLQRILVRTAAHVITVSEFSKGEIMRFLHVPANKISSIPLSGEHILRYSPDTSVLSRHDLQTGRYILAVGSRNANKNLDGLMRAFASLALSSTILAIAGGGNRSVFKGQHPDAPGIKRLGFVTDNELKALYENAACFVFPSFYEGFGLPPLEALTLGCPVVAASVASLPEVFENAATYCDPHSVQDIASKITDVLRGRRFPRESLVSFAARFTWERCARWTWEVLLTAM